MEKYTGYLFVFFTGTEASKQDEQVYFAVSRDGLHWKDLNCGQPVLESAIGECGVRDPFIIKSVLDGKYRIIATDLQIYNKKTWDDASHRGSTQLILWESDDLIHWSAPYTWNVGIPDAGCAWAPEVIFDEENQDYMIFWASMTKGEGREPKQKIYSSHTKDFVEFSKPELYIEKEKHIIDTTIIKAEGKYYRFSKDEVNARIKMEAGTSLEKDQFYPVDVNVLENLAGVEGPEIFKFNDRNEWCLIVDEIETGTGYMPIVTGNLDSGEFRILSKEEYDYGKLKKRHGSILNITEEEIISLEEAFA